MFQTKNISDGRIGHEAKDRASYVAGEFDRARGKDTAYHASHALHSLSHHVSQAKLRIRVESAEQVIRSIDAASVHVEGLFRDHLERAQAALALNKAKVVARRWAQSAQDRESGDSAAAHNDLRHVLRLRNCCHNLSLLDEIEEFHSTRARDARISRQTERLFRLPRD